MKAFIFNAAYKDNDMSLLIKSSEETFQDKVVDRFKTKIFTDGLTSVSFVECGITKFPDFLPVSLVNITIYENDFTEVPDLTSFVELTSLDVHNNNITKIGRLPESLTVLNFSENQVSVFPECGNLLVVVNCEYNNLVDISNIPKNMNYFDGSNNLLTTRAFERLDSTIGSFFISGNPLKVVDFGKMSIIRLDIGGPCLVQIKSLPVGLFSLTIKESGYLKIPEYIPVSLRGIRSNIKNTFEEFPILNVDNLIFADFIVERFGNIFDVMNTESCRYQFKKYKECIIRFYLFKWAEGVQLPLDLLRLLFREHLNN